MWVPPYQVVFNQESQPSYWHSFSETGTVEHPPIQSCCSVAKSVICNSLQYHGLHTPGSSILHYLSEFSQTHVHSNRLILCCPVLLLPSIFRVFSNELALHIKWPKSCSFNWVAYEKGRFLGLTPDLLNQNLHLN